MRAIAKLRSERAARLSREAAAGQRRMVLSAVFAVVTIGLSLAAGLGALAWPWIILGAVPLAGVLVWSRGAAIASERASHAEVARLRELRKAAGRATAGPRTVEGRQDPRTHTIMPQRTSVAGSSSYAGGVGGAAGVGTAAGAATAAPAMPASAASTAGLGLTEEIARLGALARRENMAVAAGAEGVHVETVAETVAAYPQPEAVAVEPVRTESMTWSVTPVPAPTYARRGRVAGRQVHADTDIRGIPKVEARVPARPVRAQDPATGALSTHEVVADQMVALDLEAILESRRAQ
ncbi:MAG: hypothetical protein Q4C87_05700 [Actinomycetaceae bacterium]|nr:hypothetical protein [Actinomycetaceae bacterium]